MPSISTVFGYFPNPLDWVDGPIAVQTRQDLGKAAGELSDSGQVDGDWFYAPSQRTRDIVSGAVRERPYASRVFRLPKTHELTHRTASSEDHLEFLVWALSFFLGIRLTTTNAGFLDAASLAPGKLVDFLLVRGPARALALADRFWMRNADEPRRPRLFVAAVHCLFLSRYPLSMQFERFHYCYTAIDACYALAASTKPPERHVRHSERVSWLCDRFGILTPAWGDQLDDRPSEVAAIRNPAIHEALYMGEPLGFALHDEVTTPNLTLEMQAFVCRLLVALIGANDAGYISSPATIREVQGLTI